ncbi:MAG: TOBE domain-containing protein, partial [Pseudomonas sp.]|nr:TOBE domain-containing protein [Pseudomonas sp.]
VSGHDPAYGLLSLQLPDSAINLRLPHGSLPLGQSVRIKIKARDVSLSLQQAEDSIVLNLFPARVVDWINVAEHAHVLVRVQVGGEQLIARITRYSFDRLQIQREQLLWAQVKSVSLLSTH